MRVITGSARGMQLKAPKGLDTRPTMDQVKEAVFSAIQFEIVGARVLDLFAGSGQLGIEALSRGARSCVFCDTSKDAVNVIRDNLEKTHFTEKSIVLRVDYQQFLSKCRESFDIILLDPPYAEIFLENAINRILQIDILSERGIIVCERPYEKTLASEIPGLQTAKNYRYGKAAVTIYRKA